MAAALVLERVVLAVDDGLCGGAIHMDAHLVGIVEVQLHLHSIVPEGEQRVAAAIGLEDQGAVAGEALAAMQDRALNAAVGGADEARAAHHFDAIG